MYRCEQCGYLFHESYTESWDIDDHYQDVDLCPRCHSEFLTELHWEQAELLMQREEREQQEYYYSLHPERKPDDYEQKRAEEIAEENEYEALLKKEGKWK